MKNFKRIAAIGAVVLIAAVFGLPMVFAFGEGENSQAMFRGAFAVAFLAPVLLYVFMMVYKMLEKNKKHAEGEIENIIFDVGNVLMRFGWEPYLQSFGFTKEKYERIADATFRSAVWNQRDTGILPEEEYVRQCVALAPEYEADIREVMRRTPECITPLDYADTWVKYLKEQGYHLYILSNYGHHMLDGTRHMMGFLKYMDGVVFSCDVQQIKPDRDIYETLINRYNLKPERCVFMDDREENCETAGRLGIHAIPFKNLKQAAADLEKLGVK